MGFSNGKRFIFRMKWRKNSSHPECPPTGSSSRPQHQHCHRERRFHIPRQALGSDYASYDVAAAWLPPPPSPTPLSSTQPATEPLVADLAAESLSDREVVQQLALKGMRICAWILLGVLFCVNFKWIIATCHTVVHVLRNLLAAC